MSIIAAYRLPPRASIFAHETHGQGEPAMSKPKLAIVIGSIRPNRFGGHAAQWIEEIARRRTDFEVELIDLKDYPMPLFAEEASPLYAPSKNEIAQRWQKKVGEFDAFIFTVGGARAVEQLRLHAIELQMAPIRSAIHILFPDYLAMIKDGKPLSVLEHLNQAARQMLDQLAW